jgi:O-antigen/teichoic acid export membrane protein
VTNYVLIALDQQRKLMRAFVLGVGVNLAANLVFMPAYGYRAAAIITIASELVLLAAFYWLLRRALAPVPWAKLLWRPAAAALAMGGAVLLLWPVHGLLALGVGVGVYAGMLLGLRPLDAVEMAQLAPLLPSRLRARNMGAE